jgi:folate-binding protein YgfZ
MQVTASAVDKSQAGAVRVAPLADRSVIGVTGPDAEHLLQGIVTQDMDRLQGETAIYTGLLSPQGKILFDFFVVRHECGLLIEVAADRAADLIKRLTMYRLRAKVQFADRSADARVYVAWGGDLAGLVPAQGVARFVDPRLTALGVRMHAPVDVDLIHAREASAAEWHAHRIGLGVPEGGKDFAYGDAFPHEADMDQLGGISFEKGCYVGQEVVSRMQHRGTARKRVVIVTGDSDIAAGAGITAGNAQIGTVGSSAGRTAIATVRLDRAADLGAKGDPITAGGVPIAIVKPEWATFDLVPRRTAEDEI